MTNFPTVGGDEFAFDQEVRLEELVDRKALEELVKSFSALFGISVRVYSSSNLLLADTTTEQEACTYVNTLAGGRTACSATVSQARAIDPGDVGDFTHPCFTGAVYRIIGVDYDGRRIGRLIIGPYLPAQVSEVPRTFLAIDPGIDAEKAQALLFKMPRVKPETVTRLADHLKAALDLILFSGHKTLLTSQMHVASVRESFRELQEKTNSLQEAYDRLRELDRLKSNFLATVSHELRTPLTSIIGYSEMLSEGIAGELQGEQVDFVKTIHEKGEHLLSLIMSLLDLSKLESGTMRMRKQGVELKNVLREVSTTVAPNARKRKVHVNVRIDEGLPSLEGDPERLRQVFINLVDNALKFTPPEGSITLSAKLVQDGDDDDGGFALLATSTGSIEVRVADTGIGIPEPERPKVFDAFYQVDSSSTREYGGTGLGLSIVKRLVEGHGGTIRIEGNEPTGAVFVVTFPVKPPTLTAAPSIAP
ncbi:MAG: ATP-binding protein [Polyangiaceae bacterium]